MGVSPKPPSIHALEESFPSRSQYCLWPIDAGIEKEVSDVAFVVKVRVNNSMLLAALQSIMLFSCFISNEERSVSEYALKDKIRRVLTAIRAMNV